MKAALACVLAIVGLLSVWWSVQALRRQYRLGPGDFRPTFHTALESALPAQLPHSIVFLQAMRLHAAGDVDVWVAAKVPQNDIALLQNQFGTFDQAYGSMILLGAESLLHPKREYTLADMDFVGSSRWGSCAVLPIKDGWQEVIFYTGNNRPGQKDSANALYDQFH